MPDGVHRQPASAEYSTPPPLDPWAGLSFAVTTGQRQAVAREQVRGGDPTPKLDPSAVHDPHPVQASSSAAPTHHGALQRPWMHQDVIRLQGNLNLEALIRAVHATVRRQASLRTRFEWSPGQDAPVQWVDAFQPVMVPLWSRVPEPALHEPWGVSGETMPSWLASFLDSPVSLKSRPWKLGLFQHSIADHTLVICFHEAIADAVSMDLFHAEISEQYVAALEDSEAQLPELDLQMPDVAERQRQRLAGVHGQRRGQFWERLLSNCATAGAHPLGSGPMGQASGDSSVVEGEQWTAAPDLVIRLREQSSALGLPPAILNLALVTDSIRSIHPSQFPWIASLQPGRIFSGVGELMGAMDNPMLLPLPGRGRESFRTWAGRFLEFYQQVQIHGDYPFEWIEERFLSSFAALPRWLVAIRSSPQLLPELPGVQATRLWDWHALGGFEGLVRCAPSHRGCEWKIQRLAGRDGDAGKEVPPIKGRAGVCRAVRDRMEQQMKD